MKDDARHEAPAALPEKEHAPYLPRPAVWRGPPQESIHSASFLVVLLLQLIFGFLKFGLLFSIGFLPSPGLDRRFRNTILHFTANRIRPQNLNRRIKRLSDAFRHPLEAVPFNWAWRIGFDPYSQSLLASLKRNPGNRRPMALIKTYRQTKENAGLSCLFPVVI